MRSSYCQIKWVYFLDGELAFRKYAHYLPLLALFDKWKWWLPKLWAKNKDALRFEENPGESTNLIHWNHDIQWSSGSSQWFQNIQYWISPRNALQLLWNDLHRTVHQEFNHEKTSKKKTIITLSGWCAKSNQKENTKIIARGGRSTIERLWWIRWSCMHTVCVMISTTEISRLLCRNGIMKCHDFELIAKKNKTEIKKKNQWKIWVSFKLIYFRSCTAITDWLLRATCPCSNQMHMSDASPNSHDWRCGTPCATHFLRPFSWQMARYFEWQTPTKRSPVCLVHISITESRRFLVDFFLFFVYVSLRMRLIGQFKVNNPNIVKKTMRLWPCAVWM